MTEVEEDQHERHENARKGRKRKKSGMVGEAGEGLTLMWGTRGRFMEKGGNPKDRYGRDAVVDGAAGEVACRVSGPGGKEQDTAEGLFPHDRLLPEKGSGKIPAARDACPGAEHGECNREQRSEDQ